MIRNMAEDIFHNSILRHCGRIVANMAAPMKITGDQLRYVVCLSILALSILTIMTGCTYECSPGTEPGRSLNPDTDEPVVMLTLEQVQLQS